jgi:hypothetical protein
MVGVFLALLLAAAVDFGRVFYTGVIVVNMAGEGAAYAALYPGRDYNNGTCSWSGSGTSLSLSIQERVRKVAREHGLIVDAQDQNGATITVTPADCRSRCPGDGASVTVSVTYKMDDLFFPKLLGMNSVSITRSATQVIQYTPPNVNCS